MSECFVSRRSTQIKLPGTPQQVREFFQKPYYLVEALLEPERVQKLDSQRFSVEMQPIGGLGIQIQPQVRLEIIPTAQGGSDLKIIDCEIKGNEWLNQHFHLEFEGGLHPVDDEVDPSGASHSVVMEGEALLRVCIEIPPPLRLTPRPVLRSVGTMVVDGILRMIQRSLQRKLPSRVSASLQPDLVHR